VSEVPRYRPGKAFVEGLAAALPEAFAGRDLQQDYGYGLQYPEPWHPPDYDGWLGTIALCDAVIWLGGHAVTYEAGRYVVDGADGEKYLRAFFGYIESVVEDGADYPGIHWIDSELFDGLPWTEGVLECVGPLTLGRLRLWQNRYKPKP